MQKILDEKRKLALRSRKERRAVRKQFVESKNKILKEKKRLMLETQYRVRLAELRAKMEKSKTRMKALSAARKFNSLKKIKKRTKKRLKKRGSSSLKSKAVLEKPDEFYNTSSTFNKEPRFRAASQTRIRTKVSRKKRVDDLFESNTERGFEPHREDAESSTSSVGVRDKFYYTSSDLKLVKRDFVKEEKNTSKSGARVSWKVSNKKTYRMSLTKFTSQAKEEYFEKKEGGRMKIFRKRLLPQRVIGLEKHPEEDQEVEDVSGEEVGEVDGGDEKAKEESLIDIEDFKETLAAEMEPDVEELDQGIQELSQWPEDLRQKLMYYEKANIPLDEALSKSEIPEPDKFIFRDSKPMDTRILKDRLRTSTPGMEFNDSDQPTSDEGDSAFVGYDPVMII